MRLTTALSCRFAVQSQICMKRGPRRTQPGQHRRPDPFTDTGLLCYLVGLRETEHAAAGPMAGALMENLVVAEPLKTSLHRGEEPAIYFWRTARHVDSLTGQNICAILVAS